MPSPESVPGLNPSHADGEAEVRRSYSSIRRDIAAGKSVTVLHIGAEQTWVATGSGNAPAATLALAIGSSKTASEHFKHMPPTPAELENAIQAVEDEIARARTITKGISSVFTTDQLVREAALVAGLPEQSELLLSRDAVEQTFERLAALTLGQLPAQERFPPSNAFAASVLILREFMHHLQFLTTTVKT
jgi:exopolyphosphatase/pppGpp-phosphohydrolase